jgi:hypothetical protein
MMMSNVSKTMNASAEMRIVMQNSRKEASEFPRARPYHGVWISSKFSTSLGLAPKEQVVRDSIFSGNSHNVIFAFFPKKAALCTVRNTCE